MCHIQLANGPHSMYFELLRLFAFGTFREYVELKDKLPEITPVMKKKLQHLTIVSLATKMKVSLLCFSHFVLSSSLLYAHVYLIFVRPLPPQCIPYSVLLQELDIKNVRDLEDLIIEAIYSGGFSSGSTF